MKPETDFAGLPLLGWKSEKRFALVLRVGEDCGDGFVPCDSDSSVVLVGVVEMVLGGRAALTRSGESVWSGFVSFPNGNFQEVNASIVYVQGGGVGVIALRPSSCSWVGRIEVGAEESSKRSRPSQHRTSAKQPIFNFKLSLACSAPNLK